jgi:hypothetical protein
MRALARGSSGRRFVGLSAFVVFLGDGNELVLADEFQELGMGKIF